MPHSPLVEFCHPKHACQVSIASDSSACAAAFADGGICLWQLDLEAPRLRWKVPALQLGTVVGLAVTQRLRGTSVLVAYRDGSLFVLEGGSGQVVHRILQLRASTMGNRGSREGGTANQEFTSLAVCPTDSSLLVLAGRESAMLAKLQWAKSAAVQALAHISLEGAPAASRGIPAAGSMQVAFSARHPGHVWCSSPQRPGQLVLFDCGTGAVVKTSLAPTDEVFTALAVHPREELLAAGTVGGRLMLLRSDTEAWSELNAHGQPILGLAFASGGTKLFSGAGTANFVWELD